MSASIFRTAVIIGASVGALAFTAGAATAAPPPTVTVDPATAVADGATVTVSVKGFPPNRTVVGGLCAVIAKPDVVSCDPTTNVEFKTDRSGTGAVAMVVHKAYDGVDKDGKANGKVDCGTHLTGCAVGVADPAGYAVGVATIKFA